MASEPKPDRTDPLSKLDLSEFTPTPSPTPRPKPSVDSLRAVSEAQGFPSREPAPRDTPATVAPRTEQRRYRTGRNKQLSLKVTEETAQRFTRLAEEQRLVLGELLERALDAYETSLIKRKAS